MSDKDKGSGKKSSKYVKGSATQGTVVDLNDVNFRNRDVVKWSSKPRNRRSTPNRILLSGLGRITKIKRL